MRLTAHLLGEALADAPIDWPDEDGWLREISVDHKGHGEIVVTLWDLDGDESDERTYHLVQVRS